MMPTSARLFATALLVATVACSTPTAPPATPAAPDRAVTATGDWPQPSGPWRQYATPEEAGFSVEALEAVRQQADEGGSAAVFAVYRGRVIAAWGDVDRELRLHSVRKSLVSGLYGTALAAGEIDLDATLAALDIDDSTPLTADEREARVRDLLAARSGVYLPAAYAPSAQDDERPERGAHPPDTHFFYNNWDFNVAGVIFEQVTGEEPYEAFGRRLAEPLEMDDWAPGDGFVAYEPSLSRHPAHTFRMSARDLARFGQLYLQDGVWDGRRILPAGWVEESTRRHSEFPDGAGYGYMWWVEPPGTLGERYPVLSRYSVFDGRGTGGQLVAVVPELDLVFVHRADTDNDAPTGGRQAWTVFEGLAAALTGEPAAEPKLAEVEAVPFASQRPAYQAPPAIAVDATALDDYYGEYRLFPGVVARVFEWQGRPFVFMPGQGEAELFATAEDTFTVRVVSGVEVRFQRGEDGAVTGLEGEMGEQKFRAQKLDR